MWALRAESLAYSYPGLGLFTGLDLALEPGERRAVLGPSGSGKTTLVHLLAGILPLQQGSIWWGENEITHLPEEELARLRRSLVGLVFQHHHLLSELTALENVMLPGLITGKPDGAWASELLARVGLKNKQGRLPDALSGGERQRVAVARALFNKPLLVLADEPTGSLDRKNASLVRDLLSSLSQESGAALLVATHDEQLFGGWPAIKLGNGRYSAQS